MIRAAILVMLASCSGGGAEGTGIDIATLECPPDSALTYENFGEDLISRYCIQCHATREQPILGNQALVQAATQEILETTVGSTEMPEDRNMSLAERRMLGEWLACGAP